MVDLNDTRGQMHWKRCCLAGMPQEWTFASPEGPFPGENALNLGLSGKCPARMRLVESQP